MNPPDAQWMFYQLFAQAMADPDEPRPGDKAWSPSKWHRVWADCLLLGKTLREGTALGTQASAIASERAA